MHVDDVRLRIEVVVPNVLKQHGARHNLPRVLHQIFKQSVFARLKQDLLARVEALGRRAVPEEQQTRYAVGDLVLDRLSHRVTRGGESILLQPREYRLLEYLMQNAGQVVTRTMLLEHVWDYHFDPQTNVIDVHVSRLRAKIDKNFDKPLLHTVRGAGYTVRDGPV